MSWLKRSFRVLQIRMIARQIARKIGRKTDNGWTFDNDELRIVTDAESAIIFYPNEHGDRKLVFSIYRKLSEAIYQEGEWEYYFANIYKIAKTRP